jgi:uncharacterized protein (DUF362 family)
MSGIDRRDFLKAAAILGAGAAITPGLGAVARAAGPAADGPTVAMVKGPEPAKLARAAVEAIGGMKSFVSPGHTVVVKPNIGWDREPKYAANTHPELVAEVVRMCLEAGAAKVKVFDRPCNDPRRCYNNSGIAPALNAMDDPRVEVSFIDERKFVDVKIPGGVLINDWPFYEEALKADRFINMPIAKHHNAAVLTLGMKNIMGVIGSNRAVLHKRIHEYLPDLNKALKSHLTVMDATRVLVANGPQGGSLDDVRVLDKVLAGADVVAVDSVTCTLFGLGPDDVGYVKLAAKQGLGTADLNKIKVVKLNA